MRFALDVRQQAALDWLYAASGGTGQLHFTNAPPFGTYTNATLHWRAEANSCNDRRAWTWEGHFTVLGVELANFLRGVTSADYGYETVDYLGAFDMQWAKYGHVMTLDAVVDLLLVPQFANHETNPYLGQPRLGYWTPRFLTGTDELLRMETILRTAPDIFVGFTVVSDFAVKDQVMRQTGARDDTWTDITYATLSPALNHRVQEWINIRFVVNTYLWDAAGYPLCGVGTTVKPGSNQRATAGRERRVWAPLGRQKRMVRCCGATPKLVPMRLLSLPRLATPVRPAAPS